MKSATPTCQPSPATSPASACSASPHPTGNHVARVVEYHRNGGVWIHATCVACNREWKERYRFDFAYETVTPNIGLGDRK